MALGKRIAVVGKNFNGGDYSNIDILLMKDNSNAKLDLLIEKFKPELIVVDGSDGKWKIKKWKEICVKSNLKFYDVNESGALVIDN